MNWEKGFDAMALADAECSEHDRSRKRYDKFGQKLQKLKDQIPKSRNKWLLD